ncbi:hypothetical protein PCANC_04427 [Puccinia coronata f. sp. avenae]|uniref:Uncharacterized protein n=1 Tax=Puccinia coronata f. sp. avenae TaxID=200324 RepID=A0A2N5VUN5_9BASI|nr:hypothetical protein PCANC_04427 [Puccinia coronata f. sp. avenae]
MKAMQDQTPAIKKLLDKFNKHLAEYLEKFPDQTLRISSAYPLRYEEFSKMPLDHNFWNNGLYFQSTAPWAVEPNLRTGINCVLILSRVQEEYQLIAQEIKSEKAKAKIPTTGEVDAALEEVVLGDTHDDGEEANEDWMTDNNDREDV